MLRRRYAKPASTTPVASAPGANPEPCPPSAAGSTAGATDGDGATQVVEFPLRDPIRAQLEEEASRQQVSLNELLHHAALIYLADLDAAPA